MKLSSLLLAPFIISLTAVATNTYAQAESTKQQASSEPTWAVGAGVLGSLSNSSICAPGVIHSGISMWYNCTPGVSLAVERKIDSKLSIIGQLSGHYSANNDTSGFESSSTPSQTTGSQGSSKSLALAIGPHWTFNPESSVKVGAFLMLRAGYVDTGYGPGSTTSTSSSSLSQGLSAGISSGTGGFQTYDTQQTTGYNLGGFAGLTFDAELMKNISLRIAANIVSAQYQEVKTVYKSSTASHVQTDENKGFTAGLGFEPSLALRVSF